MRLAPGLIAVVMLMAAGCAQTQRARHVAPAEAAVARVLDDFHDAAAKADGPRYFGHFAPDGVFIGTDPSERWTLRDFRQFAQPYFDNGQGWTYVPVDRQIVVRRGRPDVAWFHELLDNAKYGRCRGTGTMLLTVGAWKIAQYALSIPIPNGKAAEVVELIRAE